MSDAVRRGGFARAFQRPIEVDAESLIGAALEQYRRRLGGLLLSAGRARLSVLGSDAVSNALDGPKKVFLLVVAEDAVGRRQELCERVVALGGHFVTYADKATLGRLFGRETLGVLGILDEGIAAEVASVARCVDELSEDR
jgi:ribosomal protein L7Ae-like RNA K-turn-binding protein